MMREAIARTFSARAGIDVVASTDHGERAGELLAATTPDVAILAASLPGRSAIELCQTFGTSTRIVVYAGARDADRLLDALDAGARGFILKTSPAAEVLAAVQAIVDGSTYVDPRLTAKLLTRGTVEATQLSPRERQVLELLAGGATTQKVSEALFLSPATVRSYIELAIRKLGATNRTHAVALAMRAGRIS